MQATGGDETTDFEFTLVVETGEAKLEKVPQAHIYTGVRATTRRG